jgi:hypothetical protein
MSDTAAWQQALAQERRDAETARYDAIVNAINGEQQPAEAAQLRYAEAMRVGDMNAASDAQRAMSRAEARLVQLENGKDAFDERQVAQQNTQQQPRQSATPEQIINSMALLPEERQWLLEHKHLVTNQAAITELQAAFYASQRQGLARGSREYLDFIADRVGATQGGLTKDQLEIAKVSGITPDTYREQLVKLKQYKAAGHYQT